MSGKSVEDDLPGSTPQSRNNGILGGEAHGGSEQI